MQRMTTSASYNDLGAEFDELFDNVDKLARLEAQSLDFVLKPNHTKTVLDCACGTGIQALGLAQLGYKVSASDISERMVREVKRKALLKKLDVKVKQSDFNTLTVWNNQKFDAVINCGHSILYVNNLVEVQKTLKSMQSVIKSGGLVVISIHNYLILKKEARDLEFRRSRKTNGEQEWIYDLREFKNKKVTVSHVFTKPKNGKLLTRAFSKTSLLVTPKELASCMERSGLAKVELLDLVTLQKYKNGDWILAYGYKK